MISTQAHLSSRLFHEDIDKISPREGFGEGLVAAAAENSHIIVLCADLMNSLKVEAFARQFPDRFIEVGVAEQNLVTLASGMAAAGKLPFVVSYAVFSPGRNWEQIRTTICYNNQPVKIVGSHVGVSVGPDGATHQALEDIALMRVLPNMVVLSPVDSMEAKKATLAMAQTTQPTYLRLPRLELPVITTEETPFDIGKAEILWEGKDATIIATGSMVYQSLLVAKELEENNISVRVINCSTIKPLDKLTVIKAAEDTGALVTAEEHQIAGGLGSAIAELISEEMPVPIKIVGIRDQFGQSGQPEELLMHYHLTKDEIIKAVIAVLRMKKY